MTGQTLAPGVAGHGVELFPPIPEYRSGVRLWVGSMLRACVRGAQERNLVHFVLDEAAVLGQMEPLEDAIDKYRGYGVRLTFIYQSIGQLKKCWWERMDQTLLSNTSQVYFAVNDLATAEQVSKQLGDSTIVITSGGTSDGTSDQFSTGESHSRSSGSSRNRNDNWQQHGRALMRTEEVLTANPRMAFTFAPGVRPICTFLSRYYKRDSGNARWRSLQTTAEAWLRPCRGKLGLFTPDAPQDGTPCPATSAPTTR